MQQQIWIDVMDASGAKLGDGPITTASGWTNTRRLDAAGAWSFTMPAADSKASYLAHKRLVRCWTADTNGIKELGAGIIDRITVQPQPGGPTMIEVSGDDMLRELANRTVGDLALHEPITSTARCYKIEAGTTAKAVLGLPASNFVFEPSADFHPTFLYIQHDEQFGKVTITLGTDTNAQITGTWNVQFHNVQGSTDAWEPVPSLVDTTSTASGNNAVYPLAMSGTLTFDIPSGWTVEDDGTGYAIRLFDPMTQLDQIDITSITVTVEKPVSDGLQRIMALAPPGWSLDPSGGYYRTVDVYGAGVDVYMDFAGESVLTALIRLAEQTGNHFALSPSFRRVRWLGMAQQASGLFAIQGNTPGDSTMLIASLTRTSDSYELYNRLYAYGGGTGAGRVSLADAKNTKVGYVIGSNYLEHTASIATYGRIDWREDYPDIVSVDDSTAQITNAANALLDRMYHTLRRKSSLQYAYDLTVIPANYEAWPGQTIQVTYHEWVDGYHAVNINAQLVVLEATQTVTPDGPRLTSFVVSSVDMWPDNDARYLSQIVSNGLSSRNAPSAMTGLSSTLAGTPTQMTVKGGAITSINRAIPVDDTWYPFPNFAFQRFRTRGGVIVEVQQEDLGDPGAEVTE